MKNIYFLLMLLWFPATAQAPLTLTPQGFEPVEIQRPDRPLDRIQEHIRAWLADYNKYNEWGYDVYGASAESVHIDAYKDNAFYYQNKGETFQHRIKYTIVLEIREHTISYRFSVKEIYADKKLLNLTVAKLFNSEGQLKSDYREAKPSLEKTANDILSSFASYMAILK